MLELGPTHCGPAMSSSGRVADSYGRSNESGGAEDRRGALAVNTCFLFQARLAVLPKFFNILAFNRVSPGISTARTDLPKNSHQAKVTTYAAKENQNNVRSTTQGTKQMSCDGAEREQTLWLTTLPRRAEREEERRSRESERRKRAEGRVLAYGRSAQHEKCRDVCAPAN